MLDRQGQRRSFLISAMAHLIVLTALTARPALDRHAGSTGAMVLRDEPGKRVFLPRLAELRRLLAPAARATPPPSSSPKSRISVGAPSPERSKGPMVLRRDDDLLAVPKGTPRAASPPSRPSPDVTPAQSPARAAEARETPRTIGLSLPPDVGRLPLADRGSPAGAPDPTTSIASSARAYVERGFGDGALRGLPSGAGKQMGPLFFDPAGADFTVWVNHFKNEVYRNWILPQAALLGFKGEVDLAFVVARDGTLVDLTLVRSSGTAALDRAARNALQGSRLLPLPSDYGPSEITMQVRFVYG